MPISHPQLAAIMPVGAREGRIVRFVEALNQAMDEFGINTPARIAAFVAQLAQESGEFRYVREIADGSDYEGAKRLGNTQPGDGKRFRGRGLIQITGRYNYTKLSKHFGVDFVARPEILETAEWACRSAAWYWRKGNGDLNPFADAGNFEQITRRINGGLTHHAKRVAYWERAKEILMMPVPQAEPPPRQISKTETAVVGGTVAAGTVASAGGEIVDAAREVLPEVQSAAWSAGAIKYVIIALALLPLGYALYRLIRARRRGDRRST
jgi:putative chitinase